MGQGKLCPAGSRKAKKSNNREVSASLPQTSRRSRSAAYKGEYRPNQGPRTRIACFRAFLCPKQKAPCFTRRFQALSPWPRMGRKGLSMNIDQNLRFYGPDQTAGSPVSGRTGLTSPLCPFRCRGWAYGRRQAACPLPKGARPPRENVSRPLLSGYAAIMLNSLQLNRDGFSVFHHRVAMNPVDATL